VTGAWSVKKGDSESFVDLKIDGWKCLWVQTVVKLSDDFQRLFVSFLIEVLIYGGESTANYVSTPHQSETPQEQRFILNVNWNRSEKNFRHINVAVNFPIKRNANLHFIQHPP
jgi:hypothetical protein